MGIYDPVKHRNLRIVIENEKCTMQGFTYENEAYHNNRFAGSPKSAAIFGKPTVKRPELKLLTIVVPVRVAIMAIVRPLERSPLPSATGCSSCC